MNHEIERRRAKPTRRKSPAPRDHYHRGARKGDHNDDDPLEAPRAGVAGDGGRPLGGNAAARGARSAAIGAGQEENAALAQSSEEAQKKWVLDKDPQGNEYVAGELLVTYKEDAFKKAKGAAPKKVGGKVEKEFSEIAVQHVSVPEVKNERSQEARQKALERKKKALEQDPNVEAVGYNYVGYATMIPTDLYYDAQWAPPKINAPEAWDFYRGSSNVRIAILDSGIYRDHVDLQGKVVGQWNFVQNVGDVTDEVREVGHGTLTAGIAAASINNGQYGAGICPNCSLLVGKILDHNNSLGTTWARAIDGINWA